jgi:hypothetical protein
VDADVARAGGQSHNVVHIARSGMNCERYAPAVEALGYRFSLLTPKDRVSWFRLPGGVDFEASGAGGFFVFLPLRRTTRLGDFSAAVLSFPSNNTQARPVLAVRLHRDPQP